jgi:hypothetical protein
VELARSAFVSWGSSLSQDVREPDLCVREVGPGAHASAVVEREFVVGGGIVQVTGEFVCQSE